ncbi:MAG: ABC transporter permease [Clostridia bacterium]|nr:ABC transporter permease [Clostridia bacterium]
MVKYVIKRLLLAVFILLGVSVILYALIRCMPIDIIQTKFNGLVQSGAMTEDELYRMYELYGLEPDGATFWGVISGYFGWLGNLLQGDLGVSWTSGRDVGDMIFQNMGVSFGISFVSLIIELIIAIPLGIKCACNQYGKLDYTVTVLVMIGISFPSFFLGNLLIKWFALDLGWFETGKLYSANLASDASWIETFGNMLWHLVLPMIVLVVLNVGSTIRYMRTNTLEVLTADYIRTARAKGLSEGKVVYKHVFRNTAIPLVTMLAGTLPGLFGGAMITETVFNLPGIGNTAYQALVAGDIPFIMGYNMFIAVLTVIGILLSDIAYALVDPRVKLTK